MKTAESTTRLRQVTEQMNVTTEESHRMLATMRDEVVAARAETRATQRLAVWVGVGTALISAVIGGFAGAFAAQTIGQ